MDPPELKSRRVLAKVGSGQLPRGQEDFDRELRMLYQELLATRGDLMQRAESAPEQASLSRPEYDCALAHLDSAIVAARSMVAVQRVRAAAANGVEFEPAHRASAA